MKRYEYVGGVSRKFWEIDALRKVGDHSWAVRVRFGRLGTSGQSHTKIFSSQWIAEDYYNHKISEKTGKGYTLRSAPAPKPAPVVVVKPKPVCQHYTLVRRNSVYECRDCKSKVEFNEPQADSNTPEFETTVRRFFDLRGKA